MNNKVLVGAVILGGILVTTVLLFNNEQRDPVAATASSADAALTLSEERHDFGEIDIFGGKVRTTYTLRNDGPDDVTVTGALTSCMCTEGEIAGRRFGMHGSQVGSLVIPAGEEEEVTAIFDPLAHGPNGTGKITRELILETDSRITPVVRMMFSGEVIKTSTQ